MSESLVWGRPLGSDFDSVVAYAFTAELLSLTDVSVTFATASKDRVQCPIHLLF